MKGQDERFLAARKELAERWNMRENRIKQNDVLWFIYQQDIMNGAQTQNWYLLYSAYLGSMQILRDEKKLLTHLF